MMTINREIVRDQLADSPAIYKRGLDLYENGAFSLREMDAEGTLFVFDVDGTYGDYTTKVRLEANGPETECTCPYPGKGCKHTVAALLRALDILADEKRPADPEPPSGDRDSKFMTEDEIRQQAIEDRMARARSEGLNLLESDMLKGEHLVETRNGTQYTVVLHDPLSGRGHCDCPDYSTNGLGTCKHLFFVSMILKEQDGIEEKLRNERFPFVDLYWGSESQRPCLYHEGDLPAGLAPKLAELFDDSGTFSGDNLLRLMPIIDEAKNYKELRISDEVNRRLDFFCRAMQVEELSDDGDPLKGLELKARLYPYQCEGVRFGLYKQAALIGDEMGLGKTLQAIALAILKKEVFGLRKVLVVTLASLKDQWKREIELFSNEKALVIAGASRKRQAQYLREEAFFKITNYEAVLRDNLVLSRFKPDLVILDEAQRIKNFSTKTASAVKQIPRAHALVLTGTPLENKLEDIYSIVQFLDPYMLSPLWRFAADHFMLSREPKGRIIGYRNLESLHNRLKPLVIRRRKDDVLKDLPDQVVNNYYIDLHIKQQRLHGGYAQALIPILNKKYLTPMDLRRIQELLLRMRQACNSTYLIDRKTNISPKLAELADIIDEMAVQNNRKMVIFSEWTTMTYLIARRLSDAGINFVELSGKIPVKKRQALIDEFTSNPDCKVFLSTDAGGTGLNLQAADCVVNFEMPWNPARVNQRIGRVNRIGQKSRCVNVINLIARDSIEEKILAGIQLKTDLFRGVFDAGPDTVEFSQEKRNELLNRLREMIGEEEIQTGFATAREEIPEDTPHYLNPEVLQREHHLDFTAEEVSPDSDSQPSDDSREPPGGTEEISSPFAGDPEKLESVLDSGMQFIGGLLEMATGRKVTPSREGQRMVRLDPETGEVTLKFKLPGF